MPHELLSYYTRELSFLRQLGKEFAEQHRGIAGNLLLGPNKSEDPHVERLMQAFAFLAARIRHKLDDEFPEITDALLGALYPHYLAPIPSMSIVQFVLDPDQSLTSGYPIARGTTLAAPPVSWKKAHIDGVQCLFRTCYPVTLWPIEVIAVQYTDLPDRAGPVPSAAKAVIRLQLRCRGTTIGKLQDFRALRFFLDGEDLLVYTLYELLFNNTCEIHVRATPARQEVQPIRLSLQAVGFEPDEGMLPYSPRSFLGYRLLQEYFSFPQKFLFFDLLGFENTVTAGFQEGMEVFIFLDRKPQLERPLSPDNFRLGCSPIVNLFEQGAVPIRLNHTQTEYQVIPDVRYPNAAEVYAIRSVSTVRSDGQEQVQFAPFYSFKHTADRAQQRTFWCASHRPSRRENDRGTEVFLTLVDLNFQPSRLATDIDTLDVHTLCTNRDLPGEIPFEPPFNEEKGRQKDSQEKDPNKQFTLVDGAAPLRFIRCLKKPSETRRLSQRSRSQWRLISHLALNYLSICGKNEESQEGAQEEVHDGAEALRAILRLYDFSDLPAIQQQIDGIIDVTHRRVVGRPASMGWNGFCRGVEVTIEFDEEKYVGSGLFLFASVVEQFLGLYVSLNSFTQLVVTTKQRKERGERPLRRWQPRAGRQILL
jgi:type VI secretion system protein ImpG